ncbi:MAG: type II toxin-antitoxin system VapC family toxin [Steroidobacteraceae bacterium]
MTGVLIDSSVWVAHFRQVNPLLQSLLAADQVLCHPLIVIEIACGTPPAPRERTLGDLKRLRASTLATTNEILDLIQRERLQDSRCGAVDVALLASVLLSPGAVLWTLDKNLDALATRLGVAFHNASA